MRSFVAVELPEGLLGPLLRLQAGLPGRPVPEDNLHLTLAFLGDLAEPELEALHEALAARSLEACELAVTGIVPFGGRAAKLIAAEVAPTEGLHDLHRTVRAAAREAGIDLPRERFRPHVTLTRFRGAGPDPAEAARLDRAMAEQAGLHLPTEWAAAVVLVGSTLRPEGARHEVLARYPLG